MSQNNRDDTIDIAKGILIILMVWGHMICPFGTIIYNFHMAGFVIISGFFFSAKKSFKDYLLHKVHRLLIPYFIFILYGIITDVIRRLIEGFPLIDKLNMYTEFWNCDSINAPLWFLPALFWISVFYYIINEIFTSKFQMFIINVAIAFFANIINNKHYAFPLYISQAILLVNFFSIGYFAKNLFVLKNKYLTFLMIFLFIVISIYSQFSSSWILIRIKDLSIGNYLLYIFCGIIGTFNILKFAHILSKCDICLKFFSYEGINSLYILGFHGIIAYTFMELYMKFSNNLMICNSIIRMGLLFVANLFALFLTLFVTDFFVRNYKRITNF